jgi:hypothetical protein
LPTVRAIGALTFQTCGPLKGREMWYWASPIEARLCRDEEIEAHDPEKCAAVSEKIMRKQGTEAR